MLSGFKKWLSEQLLEPFPTAGNERNPYINGKWSTSALTTGKAKVKRSVVSVADEEKKKDDDATGYNQ